MKAVKQIKNKRSLDPNGLSSGFIKKISSPLVKPLCALFSFAFECGQIPDDWRVANIIPVFEKGCSSVCSNYRPISLTSVICKLFERVVKDQVLNYLHRNKLISQHQHGFLSRSSTCTQLLETVNDWTLLSVLYEIDGRSTLFISISRKISIQSVILS